MGWWAVAKPMLEKVAQGIAMKQSIQSAKGGVSKGGNPMALGGAYGQGRAMVTGKPSGLETRQGLERPQQTPAVATDDSFWNDTYF